MRASSGFLRRIFPVPFVAIVVLLLALLVLTPSILSNGSTPPTGSIETDAKLIVYCPASGNLTELYVEGIGTVVYFSIAVALGHPAAGPPPSGPAFNFTNHTLENDTVIVAERTAWDPVAVNVTAVYVDSTGATEDFVGTFEFNVTRGLLDATSYLPSTSYSSTPLADLPIAFLLEAVPMPGGPP